jgi:maltose-binding protein MalE
VTKKKSLLITLCIIGLSALVFSQFIGTGGNGGSSAASGDNGTSLTQTGSDSMKGSKIIKASVAMEPKEFELFSRLAKQYSEQHDGVHIEVENVPPKEAYEKWKKAGQIGEAPDLMLLDNNWVQEFAALGFLQPVGDFFSSDQQNGRISILMNQVKWNGYIWGVPKDVDPYILAWNKKTAAQYKMEHAPESPDELLAWSKAMLKPEEGKVGIYADPSDPYAFIALSSSLTGAWLNTEKLWTDEASAQKKLESYLAPQEETWSGKAFPKNFPLPSAAWSPWEQLAKGNIGAMVTTVSAFKQNAKEDIALAAIPAYTGKDHAVWLKGRSFTISSRTPHAQILMSWIKEITVPEMEIKYWNEAKVLPAQIPSYSLAPLRGDELIKSYDWLIRQGKVLPAAAETPKNLAMLGTALQKLWKSEVTVKEWLEQTGKAWILPKAR